MTKPTGKGRGRPPGPPVDLIAIRIPLSLMKPLADWADEKGVSRQEAVRRFIATSLDQPPGAPVEPEPDTTVRRDVLNLSSSGPPSILNMLGGAERNLVLAPVVRALFASGVKGLGALQKGLNASGMTAPKGGQWHPKTVARLLAELGYAANGQTVDPTDPGPDAEGDQ